MIDDPNDFLQQAGDWNALNNDLHDLQLPEDNGLSDVSDLSPDFPSFLDGSPGSLNDQSQNYFAREEPLLQANLSTLESEKLNSVSYVDFSGGELDLSANPLGDNSVNQPGEPSSEMMTSMNSEFSHGGVFEDRPNQLLEFSNELDMERLPNLDLESGIALGKPKTHLPYFPISPSGFTFYQEVDLGGIDLGQESVDDELEIDSLLEQDTAKDSSATSFQSCPLAKSDGLGFVSLDGDKIGHWNGKKFYVAHYYRGYMNANWKVFDSDGNCIGYVDCHSNAHLPNGDIVFRGESARAAAGALIFNNSD
jgi:hypothetical protein